MKKNPSKVLVIGDICLDKFIEGSVERISPEAPVPIFRYLKEKKYLGCSANVALSLSKLDISVDLISTISDDKGALKVTTGTNMSLIYSSRTYISHCSNIFMNLICCSGGIS